MMSSLLRAAGVALLSAAFIIAIAGTALAVPPGKTVVFDGGGAGQVVFDGAIHAEHGRFCVMCHTDIFVQKRGTAVITMNDHAKGKKFCFACHNGKVAYPPTGNCSRCHQGYSPTASADR